MQKVNSIQYLRALAVSLVVVFHCTIRVRDQLPSAFLSAVRIGGSGVDIFFVISGFIMWTISQKRDATPLLFSFRRLTRIVPIYWFMTALWVLFGVVRVVGWLKLSTMHVVQSLLFVPHHNLTFPNAVYPVLVPGWTLNYEMFFYAIFALVLFLPRNMHLLALSATLSLLALAGYIFKPTAPVPFVYTNPLLLEFLAGCVIGHLWMQNLLPKGWSAAVLLVIGVILLLNWQRWHLDEEAGRVIHWGIPAALIVVGSLGVPFLQKANAVLLKIGDASYSIYLSHILVLTILIAAWKRLPNLGQDIMGFAFICVGLLTSYAVGAFIYRTVERPSEAFFRSRLNTRRPALTSG